MGKLVIVSNLEIRKGYVNKHCYTGDVVTMEAVRVRQSFATWLLGELVKRDKTPADLARALDTGTSTVSNWTNPRLKKRPSARFAVAIARFLDIPDSEVLELAGYSSEEVVEATPEPSRQRPPISFPLEQFEALPPDQQREVLEYIDFKHNRRHKGQD